MATLGASHCSLGGKLDDLVAYLPRQRKAQKTHKVFAAEKIGGQRHTSVKRRQKSVHYHEHQKLSLSEWAGRMLRHGRLSLSRRQGKRLQVILGDNKVLKPNSAYVNSALEEPPPPEPTSQPAPRRRILKKRMVIPNPSFTKPSEKEPPVNEGGATIPSESPKKKWTMPETPSSGWNCTRCKVRARGEKVKPGTAQHTREPGCAFHKPQEPDSAKNLDSEKEFVSNSESSEKSSSNRSQKGVRVPKSSIPSVRRTTRLRDWWQKTKNSHPSQGEHSSPEGVAPPPTQISDEDILDGLRKLHVNMGRSLCKIC